MNHFGTACPQKMPHFVAKIFTSFFHYFLNFLYNRIRNTLALLTLFHDWKQYLLLYFDYHVLCSLTTIQFKSFLYIFLILMLLPCSITWPLYFHIMIPPWPFYYSKITSICGVWLLKHSKDNICMTSKYIFIQSK